jgi:hypothetical protein
MVAALTGSSAFGHLDFTTALGGLVGLVCFRKNLSSFIFKNH